MFILRLSRGLAPSYTSYLFITTYEQEHCLRSSGRALQVVPRTLLITKGDLVSAVNAPARAEAGQISSIFLNRFSKPSCTGKHFYNVLYSPFFIAVPSLSASSQMNFYFHCLCFLLSTLFTIFFNPVL